MSARDEFVELLVPSSSSGLAVVHLSHGTSKSACQVSPSTVVGAKLLTFRASLQPLALHYFRIDTGATSSSASPICEEVKAVPLASSGAVLDSSDPSSAESMSLKFNGSGALQSMSSRGPSGSTTVEASARVLSYRTDPKLENSWDFSTGGNGHDSAVPFPGESSQSGTIIRGPLFSEVATTIDAQAGVTLRYRLYRGQNHAHLFSSSGPFDVSDKLDQNVIVRIDTNISSGTRMLTDSNALEWIARERDQRPWQVGPWVNAKEPVSSNYYPATLAAVLPTVGLEAGARGPALSVIVGSAQGSASLAPGSLELMINRAVLDPAHNSPPTAACDNSTDNHLVTLHNLLMLSDTGDSAGMELASSVRPVASRLANPVVIFSSDQAVEGPLCPTVTLGRALPPQLELLSLQMLPPSMNISMIDYSGTQYNTSTPGKYPAPPVSSAVILLRLRHLYAAGEGGPKSSELGKPVTLSLAELFAPRYKVTSAVEYTLDGVTPAAERERTRLRWQQAKPAQPSEEPAAAAAVGAEGAAKEDTLDATTIMPMEVRTWQITVS